MSNLVRHTVRVRGLQLRVWHVRATQPDAPRVLFLHGFLDHALSFLPLVRALDGKIDAWLLDHRGHGESDWIGAGGNYHFVDYYHDTVEVIEQLNLAPIHVCGHSMSGMVATGLAALRPDAVLSLTLLDGLGPRVRPPEQAGQQLQDWVGALQNPGFGAEELTRRRTRKAMPSVQAAADKLAQVNRRLGTSRALQLATTGTEPVDPDNPDDARVVWRHDPLHRTPSARPFRLDEAAALWQAVRCPVLAVYPEDKTPWHPTDFAERHKHLRHLQLGWLPQTGHNLHHDAPEALAEVLLAWTAHPAGLPAPLLPAGLDANPVPLRPRTQGNSP